MRAAAQSISFEVSFFFVIISYILLVKDFEFSIEMFFVRLPIAVLWILFMVTELGRAPLDFPESERELVSGYNLEYGGLFFIFLFIREYGFLLFFRSLYSQMFFG